MNFTNKIPMIASPLPEISPNNNQNLIQIPIPTPIKIVQPKMQITNKSNNIKTTHFQYIKLFGELDESEGNKLQKMTKRFNINIIHYDVNLESDILNNTYISNFKTELSGTYYGVSNFNLFKYLCFKIQKKSKKFILICSGSSAQQVFDYCVQKNIYNIYMFYIFCFNKEKYMPLYKSFPKLKGIFNNFTELKNNIFSETNLLIIKNLPIQSKNLILLNDYNDYYIKFHFEIVRKYSIYKLLKTTDEKKFMELINKKKPYYLSMAKELILNDDEEMIKYFKKYTNESEESLRKIFKKNHDINNYIENYTVESPYYKYLNKFLREADYQSFRLLANHISKFIYHSQQYRKINKQNNNNTLYRQLYLKMEEIQTYINNKGRVICFPAFTSTSILNNAYYPFFQASQNSIQTKMIIEQNNCKSIISIRSLSKNSHEEEYLCLPFTFFKINNVICKIENPVKNMKSFEIYLTALNSEKPIEEMYLDFMENETDNLDPEGLDILKVSPTNDTTLILNNYLKSEIYAKYKFIL